MSAGEHPGDSRLRLLIADDHAIFRAGLRLALEQNALVGAVQDVAHFDDIPAAVERDRPDILILDLNIPGLVVPEGLKALQKRLGRLPILMLSASTDSQDLMTCLGAGASGYVTKVSDISVLFEALRLVQAGGVYVPADILAGNAEGIGVPAPARPAAAPRLTRRQHQVMQLALDGHANKEIAFRLGMSEGTVKTHLAAVMRLYDVNNRVQLLRQVEGVGARG